MGPSRKPANPHRNPTEQQIRGQEVLRANKELAAYFKGVRTEREARAALKIIKAFIRDRERADPDKRLPLPVVSSVNASPKAAERKPAPVQNKGRRRRASRRAKESALQSASLPDASAVKHDLAPARDNGT
jgi:hypothetical protein